MSFQKKYIESVKQLRMIPLEERYKFYIVRPLLNKKVIFSRQNEELCDRKHIEAKGIVCHPFWEDDGFNGKELDSEGRAFAEYRKIYPNFDLMMRQEALARLACAQQSLPKGVAIVLKAAVRPVSVQRRVFEEELRNTQKLYPTWDKDAAYYHTLEFVTDPSVNMPPHASGGTIDVLLRDIGSGRDMDMGSPINAVHDLSWSANTDGLSAEQVRNRTILREVMLGAGFAPLASEWWHFSFGDQRWAVYYDQSKALYGPVD